MIFAGLWRLRFDTNIPTIFRTDSQTTRGQARGDCSAADHDLSFCLLKGIFQALEAALPQDRLVVAHLRGHANEPWNEMADALAKREAQKSFHQPRMPIGLPSWQSNIPYLWMYLARHTGLPVLHRDGFNVAPPALPPEVSSESRPAAPQWRKADLRLSVASANVNSLSQTASGHGGKVDFLRAQMKELRLNILGIQEARTKIGSSQAQNVLRLRSGSQRGLYGTELWINMDLPYSELRGRPLFFKPQHFVTTHADPRLLVVQVRTPHFQCRICVGQGPRSGTDYDSCQEW